MDFNVGLADDALDHATGNPHLWDNGSGYWAIRRFGGGIATGLAGHVVMASGVPFVFLNDWDFSTNYVSIDGLTPPLQKMARDYAERKNLGWPDDLCSIALAAILLLDLADLDDLLATRFVGTRGSVEFVRGVVRGFHLQ